MDRRQLLSAFCATAAASVITPEIARAAQPTWSAAFADLDADVPRTAMTLVRGRAPEGLAGSLYRNGPGKFRRPGGSVEHWFDGDGLMRAYRIDGGRATVEARFIDTPKRRADIAANAVVTPGFGTPARPGAKVGDNDDVNAANISVMRVGDELWALWEGGSPIALDPADLSTKGVRTLRADLKHMPFLAHPSRGPDGDVWSLGVSGAKAIVWQLAADGTLKDARMLDMPRASYIHDFVTTPRHLVLYLQPWVQERFTTPYADSFAWRPELGSQVLVVDKADFSKRRVYELPAAFAFHFGGAWEDADGTIRFDGCFSPDPSFARENGKSLMTGSYKRQAPPMLGLVTLRPDGKASMEAVGVAAEFPRNGARTAEPRRYTLHAAGVAPDVPMFNGLASHDWKTGRADTFNFGPGMLMEEAVFVARPGGAGELDGWLLAPAVNTKAGATELHAFDARRIADGPVCTWRAPLVLPVSLHGTFVKA